MKNLIPKIIALFLLSASLTACSGNSYFEDENVEELNPENASEEEPENSAGKEESSADENRIYVYVTGAVNKPGVYEVHPDARAFEVLELAGGLSEDADTESVNLAKEVMDEDVLHIYRIGEIQTETDGNDTYMNERVGSVDDGKININTASKEQLLTLPGIGEQKAEAIIEYRNKNGKFKTPEDIKNIPGIKEGVFNKIQDSIKAGD